MWAADPKTVDGVKAAEKAWATATAAADEAALNKVLADDLTYTHSTGDSDTKAMFIGNMKSGERKYLEVTIKSVDVRLYGNSAVGMVLGTVKTSAKGVVQAPANLRMLQKSTRISASTFPEIEMFLRKKGLVFTMRIRYRPLL